MFVNTRGHTTIQRDDGIEGDPALGRKCRKRRHELRLCVFAIFPERRLQRSQNIRQKARNGHTIDDGDRLGECYYAILLHGWDKKDAGERTVKE